MLDEYRRSFAGAYDHVMQRLRDEFGLNPTGRAAKSTFAIIGKLQRESVRLSQVQDIAGCRVVVRDVPAQDDLVRALTSAFDAVSVFDRRERPSHGYRAVHLVVTVKGTAVEVQVRTVAQQLWAELSEKLADRFGIEVKYGGGQTDVRALLDSSSGLVARQSELEILGTHLAQVRQQAEALDVPVELKSQLDHAFEACVDALTRRTEAAREHLRQLFDNITRTTS